MCLALSQYATGAGLRSMQVTVFVWKGWYNKFTMTATRLLIVHHVLRRRTELLIAFDDLRNTTCAHFTDNHMQTLCKSQQQKERLHCCIVCMLQLPC